MSKTKLFSLLGALVLLGGGCFASVEPVEPQDADGQAEVSEGMMIEGSEDTGADMIVEDEEASMDAEANDEMQADGEVKTDNGDKNGAGTSGSGSGDVTDYEPEISDPIF